MNAKLGGKQSKMRRDTVWQGMVQCNQHATRSNTSHDRASKILKGNEMSAELAI